MKRTVKTIEFTWESRTSVSVETHRVSINETDEGSVDQNAALELPPPIPDAVVDAGEEGE